MTTAELVDDRILIDAPDYQRDLIKRVAGARLDRKLQRWHVPLSWGSCQVLRGVFGSLLEVGPELTSWAWQEWTQRVEPAMKLREQTSVVIANADHNPLVPYLYPFQTVATEFQLTTQRALNASEMGTGKTIEIIATIGQFPQATLPALIVCTNTMKRTWERELMKWMPQLNVVVVSGSKQQRVKQLESDGQVFIINWEALRLHSRVAGFGSIRLHRCPEHGGPSVGDVIEESKCEAHPRELNRTNWKLVVADEAHKAKDPHSKQTRSLWALGQDVEWKFALTGTPIANKPDELWSIMHFVAPEDWPAKSEFVDRYCLTSWGTFGGLEIVGIRPDTRDEFYRILDSRYIRHIKQVVLPELPDKTYTTRVVEMEPKQRKAYEKMRDEQLAELEGGVIAVTNPLAKATRLSQFAAAYAELADDKVRLTTPSCKVKALLDIVDELGDTQCVVFAESRQLIELCEAALEKADVSIGRIRGGIPDVDREMYINQFQDGKLQVMLVVLGAGAEGITLTAAPVAIFLQRSWSLVKNRQGEDRIHRLGQRADKVEVIDVIAEGTIEQYRIERLGDKAERLEEIVRDRQALAEMIAWRGN